MRALKYIILFLILFLPFRAQADIVDKLITPGSNGFPAHEFYGVFWLWVDGTFNDARAETEMKKLCNCTLTPTELAQFVALKANMLAVPGQEWRRLARLQIAVNLLQVGHITEPEFRTYYGLPE